MGYTTDVSGQIRIVPPLNAEEIAYLVKFNGTRRMDREQGPYFVDGDKLPDGVKPGPFDCAGQYSGPGSGVRNGNNPPPDQPGLWCQWVPTEDGSAIEWDGGEKFYDSPEWMKYLIDHFLRPGALARAALPFLQANHVCTGIIEAQGEDRDDRWTLIVEDNKVSVGELTVVEVKGSRRSV